MRGFKQQIVFTMFNVDEIINQCSDVIYNRFHQNNKVLYNFFEDTGNDIQSFQLVLDIVMF